MWMDQVKNENAWVTEEELCRNDGPWYFFWSEMDATPRPSEDLA
jgi:hypothetical protein